MEKFYHYNGNYLKNWPFEAFFSFVRKKYARVRKVHPCMFLFLIGEETTAVDWSVGVMILADNKVVSIVSCPLGHVLESFARTVNDVSYHRFCFLDSIGGVALARAAVCGAGCKERTGAEENCK